MAKFKYFFDTPTDAIELSSIWGMKNAEFDEKFPGVRARRWDGYSKLVGRAPDGSVLPVTRSIKYLSSPSLHVCNAKCMGGRCNGVCECRCGGKNHGRSTYLSPAKEKQNG